jgi:hypothetical protein
VIKSIEFFRDEYLPTLWRLTAYTATARALGISERAVFVWLDESREAMRRGENPSVYLFEFDGSEPRYFHQHVKSAIRSCTDLVEANFRARIRDGFWRTNKWQGRTVYREDPSLIGLEDETIFMLGLPDRLLRINGEVQPEVEWVPPPIDGVIKFLESKSSSYARKLQQNINVSGKIGLGGTQRVSWQRPAPLQQVEVLGDTLASMVVTDTDPAELPRAARDDADEENIVTEVPSDDDADENQPDAVPDLVNEPDAIMATAVEPALMQPLPDYAGDAPRYGDLNPEQAAMLERFNRTRKA